MKSLKEFSARLASIDRSLMDLTLVHTHLERIAKTLEKPEETNIPKDHAERLAELEVKMSKLWSLLTEETAQGKTKLSKQGKSWKEWYSTDK